eukprot:COSAG01_NODE_2596_length_7401_cov_12.151055_6_plen_48_part_00
MRDSQEKEDEQNLWTEFLAGAQRCVIVKRKRMNRIYGQNFWLERNDA